MSLFTTTSFDDKSLTIKKMSVFVNTASFLALQKEITSLNVDVHTQRISDALSISIKDKTIILIET